MNHGVRSMALAYMLVLSTMDKGGVDLLEQAYPMMMRKSPSMWKREREGLQTAFDSLQKSQ